MIPKRLVVQTLKLNIIFLSFLNDGFAYCVNKTIDDKDLLISSVEESLPDVPLETFSGKHYYIGAIYEGNYFQAMQFCNYHGMAVVSIETKEENDFLWQKLNSFLTGGDYFFWTSGTTLPDAHWVWLATGRFILYSNWLPTQPDNAGNNEKCLEVRYLKSQKTLVWNDHGCTALKHVICETRVVKTLKPVTNSVPSV